MILTIRPLDRPDPGLERVAKANGFSLPIGEQQSVLDVSPEYPVHCRKVFITQKTPLVHSALEPVRYLPSY